MEIFVRHQAGGSHGDPDCRYEAADRTSRVDELHELRRVLGDIRRRAQAQRELAIAMRGRTPSVLERLTQSPLVSVLAIDNDGRWIEANAPACALTGYSRDELRTMTVTDLFTEHHTRFDRSWQRFLCRGHFVGECRLRQHSGQLITVECVASANLMPGVHVGTLASRRMLQMIS
jgi:PAS domain S-box-containing protein